MIIVALFAGAIIGGVITWIITYQYYLKSTEEQRNIYSKLSQEIKDAILNSNSKKLTVKDLNKLLEEKTIDKDSGGDPLPFKACPKCGSPDLERSSTEHRDDLYYFIKCKKCDWNEWTK